MRQQNSKNVSAVATVSPGPCDDDIELAVANDRIHHASAIRALMRRGREAVRGANIQLQSGEPHWCRGDSSVSKGCGLLLPMPYAKPSTPRNASTRPRLLCASALDTISLKQIHVKARHT